MPNTDGVVRFPSELGITTGDDTVPEETVVEELRAGYMLKERVIRPSMVKVSK